MWVDALRFEMGRELARLLKEDLDVNLYVALAAVPTITEIGMAALYPTLTAPPRLCQQAVASWHEIAGTVVKDRKDRVELQRNTQA